MPWGPLADHSEPHVLFSWSRLGGGGAEGKENSWPSVEWGQSGLRPWPLGRLGQRTKSSSGQMHRPGGAAAPGRKATGGPWGRGGGALPSSWGPWVSSALVSEFLTSEPHTHFFLPHRALPVMYAVALDLRIFANNVSLVSVTVLNPNSLWLLLNFMSLLPQVLGGVWGRDIPGAERTKWGGSARC